MSMQPESETPSSDFAMMSEDEQIAYAMRMSLQADGVAIFYNPMYIYLLRLL